MQEVAVVILNYNGRHYLEKFLSLVVQYSRRAQVVVADNGSTDGSLDFVRKNYPQVQCIAFAENRGFCKGYNDALAQVQAEYYVILNSDVEVTPEWLDAPIQLFESDKNIAAIQPKLLSYRERNEFEYAGGAGGFIDAYGYPFCRGRLFDQMEKDRGQYDDESEIFWATGACLFIRAGLFHAFRGFDEDFFAHMEEIDLCWRMKNAGFAIYFTSKSTAYHVGGGTLNKVNPRKTYYNFRNGFVLLIKNLSSNELWWKLAFRLGVDYIAALKFLLDGSPKNAFMVIKAHIHVLIHFRKHLKKRNSTNVSHKRMKGTYPHFLLFHYHVKKERTFDKLKF